MNKYYKAKLTMKFLGVWLKPSGTMAELREASTEDGCVIRQAEICNEH